MLLIHVPDSLVNLQALVLLIPADSNHSPVDEIVLVSGPSSAVQAQPYIPTLLPDVCAKTKGRDSVWISIPFISKLGCWMELTGEQRCSVFIRNFLILQ